MAAGEASLYRVPDDLLDVAARPGDTVEPGHADGQNVSVYRPFHADDVSDNVPEQGLVVGFIEPVLLCLQPGLRKVGDNVLDRLNGVGGPDTCRRFCRLRSPGPRRIA